jgi:HAE1 family hydrophobic/amphiphilic exporter-1
MLLSLSLLLSLSFLSLMSVYVVVVVIVLVLVLLLACLLEQHPFFLLSHCCRDCFGMAIVTGIMLMYVVLVLLFKSFTHPLTILSALPLSFGGAFFLLLITSKSISMPVLIGMIMLTGIAAKNSILLVEYAIVAVEKGMSRMDALMDAAHKRARPILMTTVAMGAGMLPIAMGWGADVAFRSPMAIAVIGGLITSTLLSLLFVPVFYTLVDDLGQFFKRRFSRYFNAEKGDAG